MITIFYEFMNIENLTDISFSPIFISSKEFFRDILERKKNFCFHFDITAHKMEKMNASENNFEITPIPCSCHTQNDYSIQCTRFHLKIGVKRAESQKGRRINQYSIE